MGDFDGVEFAPGDVRGTRAFKVDTEGRLRGVVYETIWRPGENVARCLRGVPPDAVRSGTAASFHTPLGGTVQSGGGMSAFGNAARFLMSTPPPPPSPRMVRCTCGCNGFRAATYMDEDDFYTPCEGMEPKCSCGFYVYQRGSNDYYSPRTEGTGHKGPIGSVVRGYGKVVLCERGFRAEKAEILALYVDPAEFTQGNVVNTSLIRYRLGRNYDVPVFEDYLQLLEAFPTDDPEPGEGFWEAS